MSVSFWFNTLLTNNLNQYLTRFGNDCFAKNSKTLEVKVERVEHLTLAENIFHKI
jgi:hypothetical protein